MEFSTKELTCVIRQLSPSHCLFETQTYHCFYAYGRELGPVLKALGDGRSRAFNHHGMCTDMPCILDRFDPDYIQVFLWNHVNHHIVGGYRIGLVDDLVKNNGWQSVYLNDDYDQLANLISADGKTFELSRAFITPSYQKKTSALFLLLKGVLQVFAKFSDYRYVIGAVSLGQRGIEPKAQQLFIAALRYGRLSDRSHNVIARIHYQEDTKLPAHLQQQCQRDLSFEAINHFISTETGTAFKTPQLFRYYIEYFKARCIAYALDEKFGSIDVLQRVDLNNISPAFKKRAEKGVI